MKRFEKKFLNFQQVPFASEKTECYSVQTKDGGILAQIKWYPQWRKYCFFPIPHAVTVFDSECLKEITLFIATLMLQRKIDKQNKS